MRRLSRTLWRFGLGAVCLLAAGVALPRLWVVKLPPLLDGLLCAAVTLAGYALLIRASEGRWPAALASRRWCIDLGAGLALGALLSGAAVAILWMIGAYHVDRIAPLDTWCGLLLVAVSLALRSSVLEECLMRGVLLRQLARNYSRGLGLAVSSVVFGAIHLANPGASLLVAAALMVQAGLLLGIPYLIGGRLWLPIGVHFSWNFLQAGVFGGSLSGNAIQAILTAHLQGAAWISGGAFGIEGSLIITALCLAASLILYGVARTRGFRLCAPDAHL